VPVSPSGTWYTLSPLTSSTPASSRAVAASSARSSAAPSNCVTMCATVTSRERRSGHIPHVGEVTRHATRLCDLRQDLRVRLQRQSLEGAHAPSLRREPPYRDDRRREAARVHAL